MKLFEPDKMEAVAKTLLDFSKITMAGAFTTAFFTNMSIPVKIAAWTWMISAFIIGWLMYPTKKEGR